jgi:hypothetical protein
LKSLEHQEFSVNLEQVLKIFISFCGEFSTHLNHILWPFDTISRKRNKIGFVLGQIAETGLNTWLLPIWMIPFNLPLGNAKSRTPHGEISGLYEGWEIFNRPNFISSAALCLELWVGALFISKIKVFNP